MDFKIGLLIQLTGVALITVLAICLQRSLRSTALKYWTYAWLSLCFALLFLQTAFDHGEQTKSLYSLYFFGEYLFGFMLVMGCRHLYEEEKAEKLSELLIVPLGVISIGLPMYSKTFDEMYSVHCLLMSGFFASGFLSLRKSRLTSLGWRVMYIALGLLAVDFFLFSAFYNAAPFIPGFPLVILQFNSLFDLVLETALGFGMVIVILEKLIAETQKKNDDLAEAHQKLKALASTDPLTAAFNRHAFYGFAGRGGGSDAESVSGCVGFFDIDNLKEINDGLGHTAGDQAIRSVAHAIRGLIRAEDLIYRWGGDEFFVIMVGMDAEMAAERMERLDKVMTDIVLDEGIEMVQVGVSSGFCDFKGSAELEHAIERADAEMYKQKAARKLARRPAREYLQVVPTRLTA